MRHGGGGYSELKLSVDNFKEYVDGNYCDQLEFEYFVLLIKTLGEAKQFSDLLAHHRFPTNFKLKLNIEKNPDGISDIIAQGLSSGRCRSGLKLDLSRNNIGDTGIISFANALKNGGCPPHLKLNLACNDFGKKGINAFVKAFTSKKCPRYLTVNLWTPTLYSNYKFKYESIIIKAIESGKCQQGLRVKLGQFGSSSVTKQLEAALFKNDVMHTALACLRVHNAFVNNGVMDVLSSDVLKLIYAFTFPDLSAVDAKQKPLCVNFANNVVSFFNQKLRKKSEGKPTQNISHAMQKCIIV